MILIALLAAGQAPTLSPNVAAALADWASCLGEKRAVLAQGSDTPQKVNDATFAYCNKLEPKLLSAWQAEFGKEQALVIFKGVRENFRISGLKKITDIRSMSHSTDPLNIWGECIGVNISSQDDVAVSPELSADKIFSKCIAEEDHARDRLRALYGKSQGDENLAQWRGEMQRKVVSMIAQQRSGIPNK